MQGSLNFIRLLTQNPLISAVASVLGVLDIVIVLIIGQVHQALTLCSVLFQALVHVINHNCLGRVLLQP